ncbi:MAE_28990/MAE_18760 family HEPN-like nuclease [Acinetobacter sp. NIPH1876]|uniref:MAE_28990/MAE_18760 family HEPN-like nuclease n=1 Tax=Acinetobacter sp. NIPH1876 TaxID=2924041 RepID=UPI001FADD2B1|nr:MAE_28990/MAE_18760 family HEPN-like nuclease [Acinetobacter sp. NIPH1876]MCJ0830503.1 MAE_28990/MAE_18760 family HEPN-like nuclease [Acinetobacter sp. NIPH1876]
MKIRTAYELDSSIDHDIAWRKREFTTLKFLIQGTRNHERNILIRAAVVLLYSHWEGHIKHCALVYLNYLNHKGYSYEQLKENFLLLSLNDRFKQGFSIKKFPSQKEIFDYIHSPRHEKFNIDEAIVIDVESNLKYDIVLNILKQLGLDDKSYELKQNFIDSKLVRCRNHIAHGEFLPIDDIIDTYNELENELLDMIQLFQNLIKNAVSNHDYLKKTS